MHALFKRKTRLMIVVAICSLALPYAANAQTATPVPPTATPVVITINTNGLFTQINTWTSNLDDIVFFGVGISIAIALLLFIGAKILEAFRGGDMS